MNYKIHEDFFLFALFEVETEQEQIERNKKNIDDELLVFASKEIEEKITIVNNNNDIDDSLLLFAYDEIMNQYIINEKTQLRSLCQKHINKRQKLNETQSLNQIYNVNKMNSVENEYFINKNKDKMVKKYISHNMPEFFQIFFTNSFEKKG